MGLVAERVDEATRVTPACRRLAPAKDPWDGTWSVFFVEPWPAGVVMAVGRSGEQSPSGSTGAHPGRGSAQGSLGGIIDRRLGGACGAPQVSHGLDAGRAPDVDRSGPLGRGLEVRFLPPFLLTGDPMILTDGQGRPIEKPTLGPGIEATIAYLRARAAWADRVADIANEAFSKELRKGLTTRQLSDSL